ncbi:MAG: AI-2E family transporter [Candidatus Moranbacteria bacterium]|nr:AI-2E family transporter [Candidatus Moranbacteria bacterium]
MVDKRTIDVSTGIIFRTIVILLGIWLLYLVRGVIAIFFIALIFAAAIDPLVVWMRRKGIPRTFAVLFIYLLLFFIIGMLVSFLVPPLVSQFKSFTQEMPMYMEQLTKAFGGIENYFQSYSITFSGQDFAKDLGSKIIQSSGEIFSTTVSVFTSIIAAIAILSMTFYLSVKEEGMKKFLALVTPPDHQDYVVSLAERIKDKIGKWLQGQLFLMLVIFVLDFVALYFLGVPYALILAILGGVLEIIPYLGPIISAIPGVILGFLISPLTGLLILTAYIVIQQFENHVIVPQVMKKAVGLNPVAVILALLIGAKLGGVPGAILAIPLTAALSVFVGDLVKKDKTDPVASMVEN